MRSTFAVRETASLGIMGAPRVPPLSRETQSLGQQMLNAPVGINGLTWIVEHVQLCIMSSLYKLFKPPCKGGEERWKGGEGGGWWRRRERSPPLTYKICQLTYNTKITYSPFLSTYDFTMHEIRGKIKKR